jgi:hypothetical protein
MKRHALFGSKQVASFHPFTIQDLQQEKLLAAPGVG